MAQKTSKGLTPKQYQVLKILAKTRMPALKPHEIATEAGVARADSSVALTTWAARKLRPLMEKGLVAKRGHGLYHATKAGRAHVTTEERKARERRAQERKKREGRT